MTIGSEDLKSEGVIARFQWRNLDNDLTLLAAGFGLQ